MVEIRPSFVAKYVIKRYWPTYTLARRVRVKFTFSLMLQLISDVVASDATLGWGRDNRTLNPSPNRPKKAIAPFSQERLDVLISAAPYT